MMEWASLPLLLGIGLLWGASGEDEQTHSLRLKRDSVHWRSCAEKRNILTCDPDEKNFSWIGKGSGVQCDLKNQFCAAGTCHCDKHVISASYLFSTSNGKKTCHDQIRSQTCNPEKQSFTATNTSITATCPDEEGSCARRICECVKENGINVYSLRGAISRCSNTKICKSIKNPSTNLNLKVSMTCADEDVCARQTCECYQKAVREVNINIGKRRLKTQ